MKTRPVREFTDAPWKLEPEQRDRIRAWVAQKWPFLGPKLAGLWEECRDWHLSNGVLRRDWEAVFRNWVKVQAGIEKMGRESYWETKRLRREAGKLGELAEVIPLFPPGGLTGGGEKS